jgi:tetratricopeptide (TPR) repeat protein
MKKDRTERFLAIVGGLVIGACLSILLDGFIITQRVDSIANKVKTINYPTPPTAMAATPQSLGTPDGSQRLAEANAALQNGEPDKVEQLLLPYVDSWSSPDDQAQGYLRLGQAEKQMNHAQLAIPYIKKAYALQPTAQTLFLLAETYDQAGDNRNALSSYQQLLVSPDPNSGVDYDQVRQRIIELDAILGTQIPLPASTP